MKKLVLAVIITATLLVSCNSDDDNDDKNFIDDNYAPFLILTGCTIANAWDISPALATKLDNSIDITEYVTATCPMPADGNFDLQLDYMAALTKRGFKPDASDRVYGWYPKILSQSANEFQGKIHPDGYVFLHSTINSGDDKIWLIWLKSFYTNLLDLYTAETVRETAN
ncbi:MAG: hypothetical protein LBV04_08830 [Deferribacteraceae bacterium]|jgi:hypothetical protein|nr:hypothetical protein [Deferribacteraceae bacterium]